MKLKLGGSTFFWILVIFCLLTALRAHNVLVFLSLLISIATAIYYLPVSQQKVESKYGKLIAGLGRFLGMPFLTFVIFVSCTTGISQLADEDKARVAAEDAKRIERLKKIEAAMTPAQKAARDKQRAEAAKKKQAADKAKKIADQKIAKAKKEAKEKAAIEWEKGRPAREAKAARAGSLLELTSFSWSRGNGYITAEGMVKNITDQKLGHIQALFIGDTKSGQMVSYEDSFIEFDPLMPGQSSPFKVMLQDNPMIATGYMKFKFFGDEEIPTYDSHR